MGMECKIGIRNGGLKQRLKGSKRIKDLGGRLTLPEEREDIQLDLQEDHRQRDDREAKSWLLRRVAENQELDLVEGSIPSKTEKKLYLELKPIM
jgi:hypothetical protein